MPEKAADPSDEALVHSTLAGSREAFGLLVERHAQGVRAICVARLGIRSDLDDIVQETFLRAYRGLARLTSQAAFAGYLLRIAQNLCIDLIRTRHKNAVSLDAIELEPAAREAPAEDDRLDKLRRLVGKLPEALREALLLFYFEDLSAAQMATRLGIAETSVHQRLHRARHQLRENFGVGRESAR